jgi:uncharacterized repeat protein (TIGR03803 family)
MSRRLQRFVGSCLSAVLLAACGGGNGLSPSVPSSVGQSLLGRHGSHHAPQPGWTEAVLHRFAGGADGANPEAGLLNVNGTLYGTTYSGGAYGYGTVFAIASSGTKTVIYSFKGGSDGANPAAGLINVNGTLYGTTQAGGAYESCCGTVFAITTSGTETVLHVFQVGSSGDGQNPEAGLTNVNGTLYGTTLNGGYYGWGTVFKVTTSGGYSQLYGFKGNAAVCGPRGRSTCNDGGNPSAGLTSNGGGTALFGTTSNRGTCGAGTVFKITTSGAESVLHSFACSPDGAHPLAGLTNVNGTYYGTTSRGGASNDGTVFSITPSGSGATEGLLYSFTGGTDGATPEADLLNVNGTIYGTTSAGGANNSGTVFQVTTSGTETVLHGFTGGADGKLPLGSLTSINGTLFGTTEQGGGSCGCGTVFAVAPPVTDTVIHSFGASGDGSNPYAPLVNVNDVLYGTTRSGGTSNGGTVFTITPYGTETLVHSFLGGSGDGSNPYAPLVDFNGTLYGTTHSGGTSGGGTVFSIAPSGSEAPLYSFGGSPDGVSPYAGLANLDGRLYGTTPQGGAYNAGTVYSITPSGTENVLQSFYAGSDGQTPYAGLITVSHTLYGTTEAGGVYNAGTAFAITKSGKETVLHNFGGSGDGTNPMSALLDVSGTVYGTTESGGTYGGGTIFAISESSGAETVLHNFGASGDGSNPYAGLVMLNGTLYGTTSSGGANNQGTIYSLTPTASSAYTVVWTFGGPLDGAQPRADLIVVNGTLYGTTVNGGAYNQGTVFSLSVPSFLKRRR